MKSKEKAKQEGPLKISLPFDEAMRRALKIKPPVEGWAAYEKKLRARRRKSR